MQFDPTISAGTIITLITIIFVGSGFYYRQVYDGKRFRLDITDIKLDLKSLNIVIVDMARQKERLDNQGERFNQQDARLDAFIHEFKEEIRELRRGEGLITKFKDRPA